MNLYELGEGTYGYIWIDSNSVLCACINMLLEFKALISVVHMRFFYAIESKSFYFKTYIHTYKT